MGNSSRMPRSIRPERVGYAAAGVILLEFKKVPDILRAEILVQRGPGGLETPTSARRTGRTSGLAAPSALLYATRRPRAPPSLRHQSERGSADSWASPVPAGRTRLSDRSPFGSLRSSYARGREKTSAFMGITNAATPKDLRPTPSLRRPRPR